ncbi:dihydrofolate reductase [Flavobacteriaceae bacterium MAR_2010_72]|nr:dihydrofolate reductase [Flavobacteriaceae bacterium MAR_2010_72]TVZ59220.1 dihydrofolate reductase [Flavobacteriaceae bacterium MAR_2010_105]
MTTDKSKVTIHMVSSLDGFIAKKDGTVSWMRSDDNYEKGIMLTNEYIAEFLKSIDCYVMGSKTYEHALELGWPYGKKPVFVVTNNKLVTDKENVEFCSGELDKIINDKLKPNYKNIWMVGGSKLTKESIKLGLADKIVLTITPIILGDGILFFDYIGKEYLLHLEDVMAFKDGMVELCYKIKKE